MSTIEPTKGILARRPWLFVLLAFLLLIGAWSALITIAVKHAPKKIETNSTQSPGK